MTATPVRCVSVAPGWLASDVYSQGRVVGRMGVRTTTVVFGVLLLAGCATAQLNKGLQNLMGQPVSVLVSAWGYPQGEREIMGRKLYIWSADRGAVAVPMYGGGAFAARLACTVEVGVDSREIITSYQWNGNNGGCAGLARRIPH
jgi:hypothetical protein